MIITKDHIFIHIPKTAGKSIATAYFDAHKIYQKNNGGYNIINGDRLRDGHLSASETKEIVGTQVWGNAFKFSIVRNPFDRMVSFFHYGKRKLKKGVIDDFDDFIEFVCGADKEDPGQGWLNARITQCDFLDLDIDKTVKFEMLSKNWEWLGRKLGISKELPHINKSNHSNYRSYYTGKTKEMVTEYFNEDLGRFYYEW